MWMGLVATDRFGPGFGGFGDEGSDRHEAREDWTTFGMWWFLASIGMIFLSGVVLFYCLAMFSPDWPTAPMRVPSSLWLSTLILAMSSITLHYATLSARRGDRQSLASGMLLTSALGLGFLVLQWMSWREMQIVNGASYEANLYVGLFYILTGLHALHVIGGLVPMGWVTARAVRGAYTRAAHGGVRHCAMYWHFLGCVWLGLLAVLVFAA